MMIIYIKQESIKRRLAMNKILIGMLAAVLTTASGSVYADEILPTGATEQYSASEFTYIPGEEDLDLFSNEDSSGSAADFYSYGGNYSFKDMEKRSDPEQRKALYVRILKSCQKIAASSKDYLSYESLSQFANESGQILITNDVISKFYSQFIVLPDLGLSDDEVMEVYFNFRHDHPEFYWLPSECVFAGNAYLMLLLCDDHNEGNERAETDSLIEASVKEILEEINEADPQNVYDTVKLVYDHIAETVEYAYDDAGIPLDTEYAHSIIGVLDGDPETNVVCEGYAKTLSLLLNALHIDNIYVVGQGDGGAGWGRHAWNMIKMDDGNFYNFDLTWDDAYVPINYTYFAIGQDFFDTHIPNLPTETAEYFLYELPSVPENNYEPNNPSDEIFDTNMQCVLTLGNGSDGSLDISFDKIPDSSVAYVANYDENGILIGITQKKIDSDEINIPVDVSETDTLKIFAWTGSGSNTPAAAMEVIKLDTTN